MERYILQGGRPLVGEVTLSGAKNLASKLLLATLLSSEECVIENVPNIGENAIALEMLALVGGHAVREGDAIRVHHEHVTGSDLRSAPKNRLSILAVAPLLFRTGEAIVPRPGGDQIGKRPVDFHIQALRAMGATVEEEGDVYYAKATQLVGTTIHLPYPSVGATETVLLAGAWAKGQTMVTNVAIEPEILELVAFLRKLGVKIDQPETRTFVVTGTRVFRGAQQRVIPDRLEAISYAAAALATRGNVLLVGAEPNHLATYQEFVRSIGGSYDLERDGIRIGAHGPLKPATIRTDVYPAFVTDWQQPTAVVLVTATGRSTIHETVMDDRFGYTADLVRMGASITTSSQCIDVPCRFNHQSQHVATIDGPSIIHGRELNIPDIRAGMAQIIAGLVAEGTTYLTGVEHLDRGYGRQLEVKLRSLGATIQRSIS